MEATAEGVIEELRRLSEAATPGPWAARPQRLDDWGLIRTTVAMPDGFRPVVCSARVLDDPAEQDAARAERREPRLTAANTAFIVAAVNYVRDVLSAPPAAQDGWRDIATAPRGRDADGRLQQVLLLGRYPSNGQLTDIVQGWWNGDAAISNTEEWDRWRHAFPPLYWRPLPDPPSPSEKDPSR